MHFGALVDRCCHEVDEGSNEISSLRSDISGPLRQGGTFKQTAVGLMPLPPFHFKPLKASFLS